MIGGRRRRPCRSFRGGGGEWGGEGVSRAHHAERCRATSKIVKSDGSGSGKEA